MIPLLCSLQSIHTVISDCKILQKPSSKDFVKSTCLTKPYNTLTSFYESLIIGGNSNTAHHQKLFNKKLVKTKLHFRRIIDFSNHSAQFLLLILPPRSLGKQTNGSGNVEDAEAVVQPQSAPSLDVAFATTSTLGSTS